MRKLSSLFLLAALAAVEAQAQDAPAQPAPDAQASATADTKSDGKGEKDGKKDEPTLNARLAPGGVVGGDSSFPLHVTATVDNYVGNGMLAATQYQRQPLFGTSVSIRPSAMLPKVEYLPSMMLLSSIDFSVNNWLPSYSNTGVYDRMVRVSDFGIGLLFPGLFKDEFTGIGVTPVISARAPLSITSRQNNLVTNIGGSAQAMWNSPETPVGTFTVIYSPSLRGNLYSEVASTMPCEADVQYANVNTNPLSEGDKPLYYGREAQLLDNGECILPGRQVLGSVGQNGTLSWTLAEHNIALSVGYSLGILRPLSSRPELRGDYASDQNFSEMTSGSASYTYTVPVDFNLFITAGIASSQPAWNAAGNFLRFPLYDFVTPANNFTVGFFDVSVGI
jgi:hypothetical protein